MKNNEKEKTIFNDLIELMEKEGSDWIAPLVTQCQTSGLPTKLSNGETYNGLNFLRLIIISLKKGYTSNHWGTFLYFKQRNIRINKGEKATLVSYFDKKLVDKKQNGEVVLDSSGNPEKINIGYIKWFNVFNVEQTNMQTQDKPEIENVEFSIDNVDQFVASQKANIKHIEYCTPCYKPAIDTIEMPAKGSFTDTPSSSQVENYYSTLLHELIHWTGAKHRLDRFKKGQKNYAFEELVAETGAAILCCTLGVTPQVRKDHAQYLNSWISMLKDKPKQMQKAFGLSSQAINYLNDNHNNKATNVA